MILQFSKIKSAARYILPSLILLLIWSCGETTTPITAGEVLEKAVEKSGTRALYNAELGFTLADIQYKSVRADNDYTYTMTRSRDTITYQAKAYNGGFEYTENGNPKSYGAQNGQVEKQLLALNDFMALPAIFENDNSAVLTLKKTIQIDEQKYYVLHIGYKDLMPTDIIPAYNLYINQETFGLEFIAYEFQPAQGRHFLREAFNSRTIEGVSFNDYRTYRTKTADIALDSLPHLLGANQLDLQNAFTPENITVKLAQ